MIFTGKPLTVIKKREKGYGVTFVPGILVLIKSAAHSALGLPTSFTLQMK